MAEDFFSITDKIWDYIQTNNLTLQQVRNASIDQIAEALEITGEDVRIIHRCRGGIKKAVVKKFKKKAAQSEYDALVDSLTTILPVARERIGAALLIMADRSKGKYFNLNPIKEVIKNAGSR